MRAHALDPLAPERGADGALIVDKPSGPTSHDVVARVRRILGTRRVGHAGTLDPMATGVLVVLLGEATKLAAYLTAHQKRYLAGVVLGRGTDTLDALGRVVADLALPDDLASELGQLEAQPTPDVAGAPRLAAALEAERGRSLQVPPAYSAIQVGGRRSYDRARKGEAVDLAPRPVSVGALRLAGVRGCSIELELEVTKGYYVRSLARDLGERLGVPAHLGALRRTASGPFRIDEAVPLDADAEVLRAAVRPLARLAADALPIARLTEDGARRARLGQRLEPSHFADPPPAEPAAWLDRDGSLVAIGSYAGDGFAVERGFAL